MAWHPEVGPAQTCFFASLQSACMFSSLWWTNAPFIEACKFHCLVCQTCPQCVNFWAWCVYLSALHAQPRTCFRGAEYLAIPGVESTCSKQTQSVFRVRASEKGFLFEKRTDLRCIVEWDLDIYLCALSKVKFHKKWILMDSFVLEWTDYATQGKKKRRRAGSYSSDRTNVQWSTVTQIQRVTTWLSTIQINECSCALSNQRTAQNWEVSRWSQDTPRHGCQTGVCWFAIVNFELICVELFWTGSHTSSKQSIAHTCHGDLLNNTAADLHFLGILICICHGLPDVVTACVSWFMYVRTLCLFCCCRTEKHHRVSVRRHEVCERLSTTRTQLAGARPTVHHKSTQLCSQAWTKHQWHARVIISLFFSCGRTVGVCSVFCTEPTHQCRVLHSDQRQSTGGLVQV